MYAFFKGKIDNIFLDKVIIDVNNVGYEILMPESDTRNLELNQEVKIYTYLNVKEDEMKLFGFLSNETLEFFKKLILVSGVGPKMALGIISNVIPSDMCMAIATGNVAVLKTIPGIGPKMAQKIIFELKDKVSSDVENTLFNLNVTSSKSGKNPNLKEAVSALQVLGYNDKEINDCLKNIDISDMSVEEIIKIVLKHMQKI